MSSNVEVPAVGESITEATLVRWHKREGDRVTADEPICELETDKATVDLPAPVGGVLHPVKQAGETVQVGEVIARIDEMAAHDAASESPRPASTEAVPSQQSESAPRSEPPAKQPTSPKPPKAKSAPALEPTPGEKPKRETL